MKLVIGIITVLMSLSSSAAVEGIACKKGNDTLTMFIGGHPGAGPTLHSLQLNSQLGYEGYEAFREILTVSKQCKDLRLYARVPKGEALLCAGELISPNGIYGQVIMSKGAIEVFKNVLAPASGWDCQ